MHAQAKPEKCRNDLIHRLQLPCCMALLHEIALRLCLALLCVFGGLGTNESEILPSRNPGISVVGFV